MLIQNNENSGQSQKQNNIVQGINVIKSDSIWSKADLDSAPRRKGVNCAKNVRDIYKSTNFPCLHVLTGRVKAHKVCVINYECYHCAYDQMIDDEDMDFLNENPAC